MAGVALVGSPPEVGDVLPAVPPVAFNLYTGGKPSADGSNVYLSSLGDIDGMIARVREAGGEVLQEKQFMGPMIGWTALFKDSRGNRVGIEEMGDGTE